MRKIPFSPPDISDEEINEVVEAMRSGWITTGPRTKQFEKNISEYCGTSRTVCLNSATAALEMTLRVLGVGPGDEVITSAYTYTASASVIEHVGAKIVFVDTLPDSFELDYQQLEGAITERTKVVIPVDIGGVMVDYDKVFSAVENKKELFIAANKLQALYGRVIVMADAAHSFGSEYKGRKSGAVADFSCYSFHAVKNLTTAEGGAVTWLDRDGLDNDWLYQQYQLYSLHGQSKDAAAKLKPGAWEYDIVYTGYKCNMTDIAAAFGLKQLERFETLIDKRRHSAEIYDSIILPAGVQRLEQVRCDRQGNYHLYLVRIPGITVEQRSDIIMKMAECGIACNVHFKPLPMMTAYKNLGYEIENYPNAYAQYANEVSLPMHTLLSDEDAKYVAETFIKVLKECR